MIEALSVRRMPPESRSIEELPSWVFQAILLSSVAIFIAAQIAINGVNGWWIDELFALWASDKSQSFWALFQNRIAVDTNPPLYFTLLHFTSELIPDDRTAVVTLNGLFLILAFVAVFISSRRADYRNLGLLAFSVFLLSGPAMRYLSEARSYFLSMTLAFLSAWFTALIVSRPRSGPSLAALAAVGILAGLTHLYAALLCCSLSAGLLLLAILHERRELLAPAFALGLSSGVVITIWAVLLKIFVNIGGSGHLGWMTFDWNTLYKSYWEAKSLAVGGKIPAAIFVAFLVCAGAIATTRNLAIVFGTAFALFICVPLAISFKMPIISGKYWAIGAPIIIPFVCMALQTWLGATGKFARLGATLAACALASSCLTGFGVGRTFIVQKPSWWGAKTVADEAQNCGPGTIRVYNAPVGSIETFRWAFSLTSGLPEDTFVDARTPVVRDGHDDEGHCRVLGWAEHVLPLVGSDAELEKRLRVNLPPAELKVERHSSGYVILRRQAAS